MGGKERRLGLADEQEGLLTLTLRDLQALADERRIKLHTADDGTSTGVWVSRLTRMSRYKWRKLTDQLKQQGFVHVGGGNPWYGSITNGIWRGPPYWDESLGIAIEATIDEQVGSLA